MDSKAFTELLKQPFLQTENVKATSLSSEQCWFCIILGRVKATLERTAEHRNSSALHMLTEDLFLFLGSNLSGSQ